MGHNFITFLSSLPIYLSFKSAPTSEQKFDIAKLAWVRKDAIETLKKVDVSDK